MDRTDLLAASGAVSIAVGFGLWWLPAGLIVGGVLVIAAAYVLASR